MRKNSVGIFDSGVGGLTVMQEIAALLPHENLLYFGDTARLPYGNKSQETILRYSIENAIYLMEKNIKLLVVACNTASAFAVDKLRHLFNLPIICVIEPAVAQALEVTKNKRIAVLGTRGTIQSGVYQKKLQQDPEVSVLPIACPLFVSLVEERFCHHPVTDLIIKEYLAPLHTHQIDTVILGCTHYPLLKEAIQKELGPHVQLVDSASACAKKVKQFLQSEDLENPSKEKGCLQYFASDDPEAFKAGGKQILGLEIDKVTLSLL